MDFISLPIAADIILFALCIPLIICKWVCMKEFLFIDKLSATVTILAVAFFALFVKNKIDINRIVVSSLIYICAGDTMYCMGFAHSILSTVFQDKYEIYALCKRLSFFTWEGQFIC